MVLGIVPAAGYARRLGGLAVSKELVRVGGRPVMDCLLERMRAAADQIVVVTRPEKTDVVEHARQLGLLVVEGEPSSVSRSLLLGVQAQPAADEVLIGFPDTIWEPEDGFARLLRDRKDADVALGVWESEEPERSDVVTLAGDHVVSVDVKPAEPATNLVWGCAAVRAPALAALERHDEPGPLFAELAQEGRVRAVRFPGTMVDVGTTEALARARRLFGE
jgi:NDP-sugar pyrophosphorylase family protein